jgi:hypothetical protein
MNYSPKRYRMPRLYTDDTNAIRAAYPGIGVHDGLISFHRTQDDPNSSNATYVEVYPSSYSIRQGDAFQLTQPFKVENVGTDNLVNPQVNVYLTPTRMSWSNSEYLTTLSYGVTISPYSTFNLNSGPISITGATPPGDFYVALWLNDAADGYQYNNDAWNIEEFGKVHITSYPWPIYPAPYWQSSDVRSGPNGSYDYWLQENDGDRLDFSTCSQDGGYATFDTTLRLYDPFYTQVAYSDDDCGLQSRISYRASSTGQGHITMAGYSGAYGSVRLVYRSRSWNSTLSLTASAVRASGVVHLAWAGDNGPYDVDRATTPNFASPVHVSIGQSGTVLDDPVLNDGALYYYRAR